jgi:hypothetical protein
MRNKLFVPVAVGLGMFFQAATALSNAGYYVVRADTTPASRSVHVIRINGPINPVAAE